jgi:hypothetical protein
VAPFASPYPSLPAAMPPPRRPRHGPPSSAEWGRVYPVLDLHGLTGDEAYRRTERWLRDRQEEGIRRVVVVTGRGLRSAGLPVLRAEVEHLLAGLRGTVVAGWEITHAGGSFRVELRRPPPSPSRGAPAASPLLRQASPELRRRAEEALWELGVEPTPALLEAEIRRLRAQGGEV